MLLARNLIVIQTIVIKELKRYLRIWIEIVIPPAITTLLYFIIFGHIIGARIGKMDGFDYVEYIAPGLIMMSMITSSYSGSCFTLFMAKFQRSIEEILVTPTSFRVILLSNVLIGILRGLFVGLIVAFVAFCFIPLKIHSFLLLILVILLTNTFFALAGFINGLYAKSFDQIAIVPNFVLTPLTYLGGVFYSIQLLPHDWYYVSLINPIFYMVNTFRYAFLGTTDTNLFVSFSIIIGFIVAMLLVALFLLVKGKGLKE